MVTHFNSATSCLLKDVISQSVLPSGQLDILVSRNPDSGNMETGIPERKPPLIGLINTHKESKKCQAQSRFAGHKPALHL